MTEISLSLNRADRPSAFRVVLLAGVFLLPLEMPITEAAHGLLSSHLGGWYLLAHPFTLVVIGMLATGLWTPRRLDIALVAMAVAILASTAALGGDIGWAVRYVWLGIASISLFARAAEDEIVLRTFVFGLGVWALLGLGFYAHYFITDHTIRGSLTERLMILRSPGAEVANHSPFFLFLGNVNKAANYAVLGLLLTAYCQIKRTIGRGVSIALYALMVAILIVTFSRGGLVVCGLIGAGLLVVSLRASIIRGVHLRWLAIVLVLPLAISLSTAEYRAYWTQLDTLQTRMMMESAALRGDKAPERADLGNLDGSASSAFRGGNAILGYGIGNYGARNFGDPVRGTHNLFVDLWTDGGMAAVVAFLLYIAASLFKAIRPAAAMKPGALVGVAGILSIILLGFREYDLAYLYATGLGGAFVGLFCGLCLHVRKERNADLDQPTSQALVDL